MGRTSPEERSRKKLTRAEAMSKVRNWILLLACLSVTMMITLIIGIGTGVGAMMLFGEFLLTAVVCLQCRRALRQLS